LLRVCSLSFTHDVRATVTTSLLSTAKKVQERKATI
jgi:hypothetical protein